jgi:hypothetical protein
MRDRYNALCKLESWELDQKERKKKEAETELEARERERQEGMRGY